VPSEQAMRHQQDIVEGTRVGLPGLVRLSFGCYNTVEEIDKAADFLVRIVDGEIGGYYEQDAASGAYWPRGYEPDYEPYFGLQPGLRPHPRDQRMSRCGM
jgi:hypothetical protein